MRDLDPLMRLGGVLSSGAMFGTWMSRTWFRFYDGREYRLSYIVYVIGDPASGKSFIVDQDEMIMKVMVERDEVYRKAEEKWEEGSSANKQSKGVKPEDVEKRPHFPIRYLPTSTSNKVFYRRLKDAKHEDDEESAPRLHLYTIETELATALRSQVGSWAGKLDFELKSFQNEKAGVDYANEGSANGLVRVNWNQVISTTMESVVKKMRIGGINDGYITRSKNQRDKREIIVSLTAAGREHSNRLAQKMRSQSHRFLEPLTYKEKKTLFLLLKKLNGRI